MAVPPSGVAEHNSRALHQHKRHIKTNCNLTVHDAARLLEVSMQQASEHLADTANRSLNEHFDKEFESDA
jgi:hypothetical protein